MMKWILLLVAAAGVGAFFTRPEEAAMRQRADAVLNEQAEQSLENLDAGGLVANSAASMLGQRNYTNYYVAARYLVTLDNNPVLTCWGAFRQVQCSRAENEAAT